MKKIAFVLSLLVGAATLSYAQGAKQTPKWAEPRNAADKVAVDKARALTDKMVKDFKLDDEKALVLLEINVGMERRLAELANSNAENKEQLQKEVEAHRVKLYDSYLSAEQVEKYKTNYAK